jgi:hypothetical protein
MLNLKLFPLGFRKRLVICYFADQSCHLRTEVLLEFRERCLGVFDCVV